jgi:hypothetical protein
MPDLKITNDITIRLHSGLARPLKEAFTHALTGRAPVAHHNQRSSWDKARFFEVLTPDVLANKIVDAIVAHVPVTHNNRENVRRLLQHPATRVDRAAGGGDTPLTKAIAQALHHNDCAIFDTVLDENPDVNAPRSDGWRPIQLAMQTPHATASLTITTALAQHPDIDLAVKDADGDTLVSVAAAAGNLPALTLLTQIGAAQGIDELNPVADQSLLNAVWSDQKDVIAYLMTLPIPVAQRHQAMQDAAQRGHFDCVSEIVVNTPASERMASVAELFRVPNGEHAVMHMMRRGTLPLILALGAAGLGRERLATIGRVLIEQLAPPDKVQATVQEIVSMSGAHIGLALAAIVLAARESGATSSNALSSVHQGSQHQVWQGSWRAIAGAALQHLAGITVDATHAPAAVQMVQQLQAWSVGS